MLPALAARLRAVPGRFLFVVGKGGVGKTTTAAATALYLADSGHATHLISTDPAHSLGDIFDVELPGVPVPSPCHEGLVLEELDARAYSAGWVERISGPIAQLVERGTYLDAEDARSLGDLSLPGVDELMAALRLVELSAEGPARVVVDTAPTGHALRLLDAGSLIAGWAEALDAMARKASVVGAALVGAPVRVPGQELVDELRRQVERFRTDVLARAGFVVVQRPGAVVQAETEQLLAALTARGLTVTALLCIGGHAGADAAARAAAALEAPAFSLPLEVPPPRGCAALRAWGTTGRRGGAAASGVPGPDRSLEAAPALGHRSGTPAGLPAERLAGLPRSLYLFAGKGGVGKTTCACAFGLHLAQTRPAVLLSTDPAGSLGDVLGQALPADGLVLGGLRAVQVDAAAELARVERDYRARVADAFRALGLDTGASLDRAVVEALWGMAPPGLDELLGLVGIGRTLEQSCTLVIDPAPTGHFLRLLETPAIALDWVHALMRLILKYHLAGRLDAIARDLLQLARDLKEFMARLTDPERTAAVVVTLAEPVVAAETLRLLHRLDSAGVSVQAMLVNRAAAGPRRRIGETADAAPAAEQAGARPPTILAPDLTDPPIAPGPLRAFARRWEYAS